MNEQIRNNKSTGQAAPEAAPGMVKPKAPRALLEWVKTQKPSMGEPELEQAVASGLLSVEVEPDETHG